MPRQRITNRVKATVWNPEGERTEKLSFDLADLPPENTRRIVKLLMDCGAEQKPTHDPTCPCRTVREVEMDGRRYAVLLAHGGEGASYPWMASGSGSEGYGYTVTEAVEEWKSELRAMSEDDRESLGPVTP